MQPDDIKFPCSFEAHCSGELSNCAVMEISSVWWQINGINGPEILFSLRVIHYHGVGRLHPLIFHSFGKCAATKRRSKADRCMRINYS